jgi:hypothetical protein
MACAEMVASHIGCRNTEHAKKCILMAGLKVAQKAAVIVADFDESILDKVSNQRAIIFSISLCDPPNSYSDRLFETADKFIPCFRIS